MATWRQAQWNGSSQDVESASPDIFSFSVIAFELLTSQTHVRELRCYRSGRKSQWLLPRPGGATRSASGAGFTDRYSCLRQIAAAAQRPL
jgi:hypothetical protein